MRLRDLGADLNRKLLEHLGLDNSAVPEPTMVGLRTLHRAFLDRVPYENLQIRAGIPTSLDPVESAERIVTGRGGYCYHLNGTLGSLLRGLGFTVRLAIGNPDPEVPANWGRHVLLLVEIPDEGSWLADVGIGDGFRDPLPLRPGTYRQGPFEYAISRVDVDPPWPPPSANGDDSRSGSQPNSQPNSQPGWRPGWQPGWRWRHDPLGTLRAFDLDPSGYDPPLVQRMHRYLSTSPESPFVRLLTVQSRRADRTVLLRGCVLTVVDASGKRSQDLDSEADWWSAIVDEFGIRIDGFAPDVRDRLWRQTRTGHESWDAAGRP